MRFLRDILQLDKITLHVCVQTVGTTQLHSADSRQHVVIYYISSIKTNE